MRFWNAISVCEGKIRQSKELRVLGEGANLHREVKEGLSANVNLSRDLKEGRETC